MGSAWGQRPEDRTGAARGSQEKGREPGTASTEARCASWAAPSLSQLSRAPRCLRRTRSSPGLCAGQEGEQKSSSSPTACFERGVSTEGAVLEEPPAAPGPPSPFHSSVDSSRTSCLARAAQHTGRKRMPPLQSSALLLLSLPGGSLGASRPLRPTWSCALLPAGARPVCCRQLGHVCLACHGWVPFLSCPGHT